MKTLNTTIKTDDLDKNYFNTESKSCIIDFKVIGTFLHKKKTFYLKFVSVNK